MSSLGVKIGKNIVLVSIKSVTLHDEQTVQLCDLSSHFIFWDDKIGKNRALAHVQKRQELNNAILVSAQCEFSAPCISCDFGPKFILCQTLEITDKVFSTYKNQGGFDFSGRTKDQIRTIEKINVVMTICHALQLYGLVIVGDITSNIAATHPAKVIPKRNYFSTVVSVLVSLNGARS